jgi:2',3'-cyclic-nucleotide 2'-phosphodiesterase (5'-nucleotidase family)
MNTRRKFLLKGSMATTAFFTAKPFKTLANSLSPITGYSINDNKVVLVHTGYAKSANQQQTINHIASLKRNTANLILLQAGDAIDSTQLNYDVRMHTGESNTAGANEYSIVYKGNIKIGVIPANKAAKATINKVNSLASFLKKQKDCHMVVCVSQLGFRNASGIDDISLAAASADLDIIIGGNARNYCKQPNIALNKNKQEVIIHHAADQDLAFRKLEIEFDDFGRKKQVAFTRTIPVSQAS